MLLRNSGSLLLLLLVLAYASSTAPQAKASLPKSWQTFESKEGRFRAVFPSTPVETTETRDTIVGSLTGYRFEVEDKNRDTFFLVEYRDLPTLARFFMSDETLVRRAATSLAEHVESTVQRDERSEMKGHESRSLRFQRIDETKQLRLALVILVEKRLYLVIAGVPPGPAQEKLAAEFIASFEFWR